MNPSGKSLPAGAASRHAYVDVTRAGERLRLLPQRAVWWEARRTLLIADPHFGKAATYRALGLPVPRGTTLETLARLEALLAAWPTEQLVVLGDFLHARPARAAGTLAALQAWRKRHAGLRCLLVRGNHDSRAGDPPLGMHIQVVDEPHVIGNIECRHLPPRAGEVAPHCYALAGHLHPSMTLHGRAHERLHLPCFHFGPAHGILPAFGAFTGTWPVSPTREDQVYVVAGDSVLAVAPEFGQDGGPQ